MKKINNPYDREKNMCFGCSERNPIGLKLKFLEDENAVHATWLPEAIYSGYPNILHGGIISALLDETGAWCVSVKCNTAGVTTEMKIRYLAPVYINSGEIRIRAEIQSRDDKEAVVLCKLLDSREKLCAEAEARFFLYPEEIARRRFSWPGADAFRAG